MICVVAREAALGDEKLMKMAESCDGVVEAEDLDISQTGRFLNHLMTSRQPPESPLKRGYGRKLEQASQGYVENAGTQLAPVKPCTTTDKVDDQSQVEGEAEGDDETLRREVLARHLHNMTGGNPNALQSMFGMLEKEKVVRMSPGGLGSVAPAYADINVLKDMEVPEALIGMAFSFFESLEPLEQTVMKALSACQDGVGTIQQLSAKLPGMLSSPKIESICNKLSQPGVQVLRREANPVDPVHGAAYYSFYSGLLAHAVSTLVVEKQRTGSKPKPAEQDQSAVQLPAGVTLTLPFAPQPISMQSPTGEADNTIALPIVPQHDVAESSDRKNEGLWGKQKADAYKPLSLQQSNASYGFSKSTLDWLGPSKP